MSGTQVEKHWSIVIWTHEVRLHYDISTIYGFTFNALTAQHIFLLGIKIIKLKFDSRSAISRPEMAHLVPRFYTYLSLSGPHLGTLYNNSGLVNMGESNVFLVLFIDQHFN